MSIASNGSFQSLWLIFCAGCQKWTISDESVGVLVNSNYSLDKNVTIGKQGFKKVDGPQLENSIKLTG